MADTTEIFVSIKILLIWICIQHNEICRKWSVTRRRKFGAEYWH